MSRPPLPDQEHRDVISGHAPGSLERTVFVDAGAGTGKTTALVDRVVSLLLTGVPVREIAAITFTEAAASELRHRVREAIEAALDQPLDEPAAELLRQALLDIDEAAFTTLHAFAQRILLEHPLEAQLPPELELLSDIEEAARFEERWDAWLSDFVGQAHVQPVLEQLDLLDIAIPRIRRLARALHDDFHRIPAALAVEPTAYAPPPLDLAEVLAELDAFTLLADEAAEVDPADKLVQSLRTWVDNAQPLRDAVEQDAPLDAQLAALEDLKATPLHRGGAQKAWGSKERVSAVTARRREFRDEVIERVYAAQYDHVLRSITRWVACFVLEWAGERRRLGELVFQDLLVLARDLLRDDARVRQEVRARYQHLLVDEFQDTDPIQIEIAVLLAAEDHDALAAGAGPDGSVPWQDATLVPGRLFFVGDPKQSIYRFRGADIAVYEGAKAFVDLESAGEVRELTHNFRSVPAVLGWVNVLFERVLVPREQAQPTYLHLTGEREPIAGEQTPAVRWFGGPGGSAQDVRATEAQDVVGAVRALVGQATVADPRTGESRPARADDIAVLVRRHATARQLERCFDDAGLPLVVEARSLIFSSDEVRDLTTILTAIEDPNDQVAILGALRHPAFGCSDDDLVDWSSRSSGWWLPRAESAPEDHPVARALHRLAVLRADRLERTVGGFVEKVIAETGMAELAVDHVRYRDRWRRIRFVADQAHAFHEAGGHLRGFVRWLRDQADEGVRRDEHVVPDPDDDAVHVTTVHAAKGLEYPIVIVLGLDTATDRPLHDATLLWGGDDHVEVNVASAAKTDAYQELRDAERQFHAEEEQRLLYVATTRARDLLVVSRYRADRNDRCHAAALDELEDVLDPYWSQLDLGTEETAVPTESGTAEPLTGDSRATFEDFASRLAEVVAGAERPRVVAATTIARLLAEEDARDDERTDEAADEPSDTDRPQPWRKGRSGSAIGRAVHAVLQTVDLSSLDGLDAITRVQCAAEGLGDEAATDVATMVQRAVETPVVQAAVAHGRYARELHVGAPVELDGDGDLTITVEGFIDLLIEENDGLVVVDYKTDTVRGRTPDQVVERYRPQAATYALALETALQRPVTRCVFVLTGATDVDQRQVEIAGELLAAAKDQLLVDLTRVVAEGRTPAPRSVRGPVVP